MRQSNLLARIAGTGRQTCKAYLSELDHGSQPGLNHIFKLSIYEAKQTDLERDISQEMRLKIFRDLRQESSNPDIIHSVIQLVALH